MFVQLLSSSRALPRISIERLFRYSSTAPEQKTGLEITKSMNLTTRSEDQNEIQTMSLVPPTMATTYQAALESDFSLPEPRPIPVPPMMNDHDVIEMNADDEIPQTIGKDVMNPSIRLPVTTRKPEVPQHIVDDDDDDDVVRSEIDGNIHRISSNKEKFELHYTPRKYPQLMTEMIASSQPVKPVQYPIIYSQLTIVRLPQIPFQDFNVPPLGWDPLEILPYLAQNIHTLPISRDMIRPFRSTVEDSQWSQPGI